uniref:RRM domain-containing protein n=1 Tax=Chenopodium quinoa TaxID=63459 RepID=A0A803LYA8_CHEQI
MMQQPSSGVVPPSMQQPPVDPNQQHPPAQYGQPQQPWMMMAPPPPQPQQPPYAPQMWPPQTPQQPGNVKRLQVDVRVSDVVLVAVENYSVLVGYVVKDYRFVVSVKVIRNKQTNLSEGYGFVEFVNRAAAERTLATYNGTVMPQTEQAFRLNWASLGAGQRKQDDSADYTVFVGDLAAEVSDVMLQDAFRVHYSSVKGAKVITDHITGRSKGYGFVRFADEGEQQRAMTEMNGVVLSTRPMRTGPAANKKPVGVQQKASYQTTQGNPGENDPNNTTIFVGGLDPNVTDDQLRQVFSPYGELVHVKIPVGKGCGFVQFGSRAAAEQALAALNGAQIGSQSVRLSWGRSPSAKQVQPGQAQWNGAYGYGYPQGGYDAYGYAAAAPQDPNMYYANYAGYGNYQQTQQ